MPALGGGKAAIARSALNWRDWILMLVLVHTEAVSFSVASSIFALCCVHTCDCVEAGTVVLQKVISTDVNDVSREVGRAYRVAYLSSWRSLPFPPFLSSGIPKKSPF